MAPRRRALSLSALIRSRALQRGVLGSSPLWRAVALVVFGRQDPEADLRTERREPRHREAEGGPARADRGDRTAEPPRATRSSPAHARERHVRDRRPGAAARHQAAPLPRRAQGGWRVPQPRRLRTARRHRGRAGRRDRAVDEGRRVHRAASDARGLRGRDATGRAGDLSEGPRADLHARRHRAGHCGCSRAGSGRERCR